MVCGVMRVPACMHGRVCAFVWHKGSRRRSSAGNSERTGIASPVPKPPSPPHPAATPGATPCTPSQAHLYLRVGGPQLLDHAHGVVGKAVLLQGRGGVGCGGYVGTWVWGAARAGEHLVNLGKRAASLPDRQLPAATQLEALATCATPHMVPAARTPTHSPRPHYTPPRGPAYPRHYLEHPLLPPSIPTLCRGAPSSKGPQAAP